MAEQRAKSRAYEEQRRQHAWKWFRRGQLKPERRAKPAAAGRVRKPAREKIHDKRQGSPDV